MSVQTTLLRSWQLNDTLVSLAAENGQIFAQVTDLLGIPRKADECIAQFSLTVFQNPKAYAILSDIYPRIALLSDGSLKIYFNLKLKGGGFDPDDTVLAKGLGIQTETNEALEEKIRKHVNPNNNGYTKVSVSIVPYSFPRQSGLIMARKISLSLTAGQSFAIFFEGLFALLDIKDPSRFTSGLDSTAITSVILGNPDPLAQKDLISAFERGEQIDLYISLDLEHLHGEFSKSTGCKVASGCTIQ